jgi:hypothetical protein
MTKFDLTTSKEEEFSVKRYFLHLIGWSVILTLVADRCRRNRYRRRALC